MRRNSKQAALLERVLEAGVLRRPRRGFYDWATEASTLVNRGFVVSDGKNGWAVSLTPKGYEAVRPWREADRQLRISAIVEASTSPEKRERWTVEEMLSAMQEGTCVRSSAPTAVRSVRHPVRRR